jgi:hypothetical protein
MADINEVVVRGSAAVFAQEILAASFDGRRTRGCRRSRHGTQLPTTYYLLPWALELR